MIKAIFEGLQILLLLAGLYVVHDYGSQSDGGCISLQNDTLLIMLVVSLCVGIFTIGRLFAKASYKTGLTYGFMGRVFGEIIPAILAVSLLGYAGYLYTTYGVCNAFIV